MKILNYEELFVLLTKHPELMDETVFYFIDDENELERYIGYLPSVSKEKPYWAGYCDILDGAEFKTPKELLESKIWNGKSIKERFNDIVFISINGIDIDDVDIKV